MIPIALPSFLIGVLAWARLILYPCTWSTWPSATPTRSTFGIYGKTASIIFSVEKLELFSFLLLFLLFGFLSFAIVLLTKVLSLILQYTLLHLLLGEPFVFLYHHQQLGLVDKIKWFIDVFAGVLDVVLSYLVCFVVHFGFGLVLSCENHLRWLLAVFLCVFAGNVGANFLGWTAARSFIRFGFRMLGVTSGHVDNRWCSKVQNWIIFHDLTTCSLFQAETWKLPSIGASTGACLPRIPFFRQRPLQFLAIIGVSRILLAIFLVLICAMVKRFYCVLMLRLLFLHVDDCRRHVGRSLLLRCGCLLQQMGSVNGIGLISAGFPQLFAETCHWCTLGIIWFNFRLECYFRPWHRLLKLLDYLRPRILHLFLNLWGNIIRITTFPAFLGGHFWVHFLGSLILKRRVSYKYFIKRQRHIPSWLRSHPSDQIRSLQPHFRAIGLFLRHWVLFWVIQLFL